MKRKVIFMGSKPIGYKCLEILLDRDDVEIIGVLTKDIETVVWWENDYRVYKLANKNNIPLLELSEILNFDMDYIISIQYHQILEEKILKHPKYGAINLHMAPLPEYRGCNQFTFAILNKEKYFGTSLHYIDPGIDSGDIIAEKRFKISDEITVTELYSMTEKKSIELFKENIGLILNLKNKRIPQKNLINERGSHLYYRKDIEDIKELKLEWGKEKLYRYVRALDFPPFEPPYFRINNKKIYLSFNY